MMSPNLRKGLGILAMSVAGSLALQQFMYRRAWEWEQTLEPVHHEGLAVAAAFIGLVLLKGR